MDRIALWDWMQQYIRKNKGILLCILLGIMLMLLPAGKDEPENTVTEVPVKETSLEQSLAEMLLNISGAGKVEVLLSECEGKKTLYQCDDSQSTGGYRKETVIISGTDHNQTGLIAQINPPIYQGAVVLCQGADNANVKLAIVQAVKCVTGLPSDRIAVLKMK